MKIGDPLAIVKGKRAMLVKKITFLSLPNVCSIKAFMIVYLKEFAIGVVNTNMVLCMPVYILKDFERKHCTMRALATS